MIKATGAQATGAGSGGLKVCERLARRLEGADVGRYRVCKAAGFEIMREGWALLTRPLRP